MDINIKPMKSLIKNKKISKIIDNTDEKSFITEYNFFSENNIYNCNLIKRINNYCDYFIVIDEYEKLKMMSTEYLNYDIDKEYVMMRYNINTIKTCNFNNFFKNLPNPKLFIYHLFDSYTHILKALNKLLENKLYFIDFSAKNIIFDDTFKPKIINFDNCVLDEKNDNIVKILNKCDNFTLLPIELHLLFYVIQNKIDYISSQLINEIVENFICNIPFLNLFSENYKNQYKEECTKYLDYLNNKPSKYAFVEINNNKHLWANYSLSIIYLYLVGNTIKIFNIKNTIFNKLLLIFNKNIHPNPIKRENTYETLKKIDLLMGEYCDWNFADNKEWNIKFKDLLSNL